MILPSCCACNVRRKDRERKVLIIFTGQLDGTVEITWNVTGFIMKALKLVKNEEHTSKTSRFIA
jgi:hypothetical protein